MKVFCGQLDLAWEDKIANHNKARALLARTSIPPGSLLVLPEMFPTGFTMNAAAACEGVPSETEQFLTGSAREHRIYIQAGLVSSGADGRPRNQAVVFSPEGNLVARYSKIHPFTLGGESACYAAGTELVHYSWGGLVVTPFICYDLRFPEIFRSAVLQGTQLFVVIANWPIKRDRHWVMLLQARAIENQAYVVGVNRCGQDPKYTYSGRSMIVDPHGNLLNEMGNEEGLINAEIDVGIVESWRKDFPALQDMHWK
jgi:predicted amidohydrolase